MYPMLINIESSGRPDAGRPRVERRGPLAAAHSALGRARPGGLPIYYVPAAVTDSNNVLWIRSGGRARCSPRTEASDETARISQGATVLAEKTARLTITQPALLVAELGIEGGPYPDGS